jgi:purine-nucleoside phosphorylase
LNKKYLVGEIVDIDSTGNNPLIGIHYDEFGERFPSMGNV